MENFTLTPDEETYRQARIPAARRDPSVSSLVKQYLPSLATTEITTQKPASELDTLPAEISSRHPGFQTSYQLAG